MDSTTPMPIAVVGMACRLPGGVDNLESFWDFCEKGLSAWTEIPQERMNASAYQHPNPEKAGHVGCCFFFNSFLFFLFCFFVFSRHF